MPGEEGRGALGSFGDILPEDPALTLGLWGISPALTFGAPAGGGSGGVG